MSKSGMCPECMEEFWTLQPKYHKCTDNECECYLIKLHRRKDGKEKINNA